MRNCNKLTLGRDTLFLVTPTNRQVIRSQYIIGVACGLLLAGWSTGVQHSFAEPVKIRISDAQIPEAPATNSGAARSPTQLTQPESAITADSRVFPRILRERSNDNSGLDDTAEGTQK